MNKKRKLIFDKFNGRCAYCGCELPEKGWHIDEIKPCVRNFKWNDTKGNYVHDGTYEFPERLVIENQNPACASCNINKHSLDLEEFRNLISGFINSLNQYSTQYKIAKRYGLVNEEIKPVKFYFETVKG